MNRLNSSETGIWGEKKAEEYLKAKGYKILGRRVHVGDRDELDLVARDGEMLVFVEVKTRGSQDFGRPFTAVDGKKRHVMSRAAVRYLKEIRYPKINFRFDVVEVVGNLDENNPTINHIESAFALDKKYSIP